MPPTDTSAPAPTPVPEPPKKQGFFAKLFGGKKAAAPAVPENHESQTPPPQLDETPASLPDLSVPADPNSSANPVTTTETTPLDTSGESLPATPDVPPSVTDAEALPPETAPTEDSPAPSLESPVPAKDPSETPPPPAGPPASV
jgi:hypothetical protein